MVENADGTLAHEVILNDPVSHEEVIVDVPIYHQATTAEVKTY